MILHTMRLKGSLFFGFISLSCCALAQQADSVSRGTIEEIDVIRDYRPILADAVKIRRSPDMTNIRPYQPQLAYNILNKKLDINTGTRQLDIRELPPARPEALLHNYAKVGVGNYSTLLGEVYINTGEDAALQMGGFAKHLSQNGKLPGQHFSQQQLAVFGRNVLERVTVSGELGYSGYGTGFYAYIDTVPTLNPAPDKQRFNNIYFNGELISNYDHSDDSHFSYSLKADAYLFSNRFSARENSVALSGYLNKQVQAFNIGANVSADFTSVKDNAYSLGNHVIQLNPYIRFQGPNYKVTLGANFVTEPGDSTRTNLFPTGEVELGMIPEYVHVFGGVKGGVAKTSLRDLATENPFLAENIAIANAVERLHIYAGIKGNAGATFNYKATAIWKKIEDMPFFVNTLSAPSRFDVIYDRGEGGTKVTGLEGEVNLRISETFILGGKVHIFDYNTPTESRAWYMPEVRMEANARINISEKFYVNGDLLFNGQTYARTYPFTNDMPYGMPTPITVAVPAFADLSAGAEYRFTNQFGVYIRLNNMLGNAYERYLYYPRLGTNFFGGVNYSF